jgi:putative hydrolase of the HAD superfamily
MPSPYSAIFRRHCRPLRPIATQQSPVLRKLGGIQAVLFDLYGTMFISASGDVGVAREAAPEAALADALKSMDVAADGPVGEGLQYLFERIDALHAEARQAGIDFPEVDIAELWAEVLAELARRGAIEPSAARRADPKRLAVEYEARVNPCWPMPDLPECLSQLRQAGRILGIVSNAQFYTPELFDALLGERAESWGFLPELQYYSYQHGRAKPGLTLFELAANALEARGIAPGEVLCVGNDMLNDILPADRLGFRTALFAGDARSFRPREGDGRVEGLVPDLILTALAQLTTSVL